MIEAKYISLALFIVSVISATIIVTSKRTIKRRKAKLAEELKEEKVSELRIVNIRLEQSRNVIIKLNYASENEFGLSFNFNEQHRCVTITQRHGFHMNNDVDRRIAVLWDYNLVEVKREIKTLTKTE